MQPLSPRGDQDIIQEFQQCLYINSKNMYEEEAMKFLSQQKDLSSDSLLIQNILSTALVKRSTLKNKKSKSSSE
jgi:hypothetical protein